VEPIPRSYACPTELPASVLPYGGPTPAEAAEGKDPEAAQAAVAAAVAAAAAAARPLNALAGHLRHDPRLYLGDRQKVTSLGVPYGLCIRPGLNLPNDCSACGFVAGDEESCECLARP
jgi:hypothetical protein